MRENIEERMKKMNVMEDEWMSEWMSEWTMRWRQMGRAWIRIRMCRSDSLLVQLIAIKRQQSDFANQDYIDNRLIEREVIRELNDEGGPDKD